MPKTKCSKEARVQKVLAQISKNHNTRYMNQDVIEYAVRQDANAHSCHCDDKEIQQKAAAMVARFPKTKIDPLLLEWAAYKHIKNNYQTITLEQAYAQGDIVLTADTGAIVQLDDGFSYVQGGTVDSVVPSSGTIAEVISVDDNTIIVSAGISQSSGIDGDAVISITPD